MLECLRRIKADRFTHEKFFQKASTASPAIPIPQVNSTPAVTDVNTCHFFFIIPTSNLTQVLFKPSCSAKTGGDSQACPCPYQAKTDRGDFHVKAHLANGNISADYADMRR